MRLIVAAMVFMSVVMTVHAQTNNVQTNNWSKRIISEKHRPLASFLNPHVSTVNVLVIDGRRFERVRGIETFYLPVPTVNAIVFIVDEKDYSVTYHVFKMDTDTDIAIPARSSVFGRSIGSQNSQDAIEGVTDGKIVLSTRSGPNTVTKTLIYLDLNQKSVVGQKTLFFDKTGNVIRQHDDSPPF